MGRQRTKERKTNKASAYQGAWVKCAPVSFGTPCRDGACQHFPANWTAPAGPHTSGKAWLSMHDRPRSSHPATASLQSRKHLCSGISHGEPWAPAWA